MAIIFTLTLSTTEILPGIPESVTIETNIPSTVFYTLDNSTPNTDSLVYLEPIHLPKNNASCVLRLWATDGEDESEIFTQTYGATLAEVRLPHDRVLNSIYTSSNFDYYPFGNPSPLIPTQYGNTAELPLSTENATIIDGYDGTATGAAAFKLDRPIPYHVMIYSETDAVGNRGRGIGTLPAKTSIRPKPTVPESSDADKRGFNPKALVIYQDSTKPSENNDISQMNPQFFSFLDLEKDKNGALLFTTAFDGIQPTGGFLRAYYNPRDNTTTYYYYDNATGRWIISKEPTPLKANNFAASGLSTVIISSRKPGSSQVIPWYPFMSRRLL